MLTLETITDLLSRKVSGADAGRLAYVERQGGLSPAQLAWIADFRAAIAAVPDPVVVRHPADNALAARRDDGPLTPADTVWLQRLPADPAAVSWADAQRLAVLALRVPQQQSPGDAILLESIWAPVRERHDRRVAEAELTNAGLLPPTAPASTPVVVADLLAAGSPDLRASELATRADELVSEALAVRLQRQEQAAEEARSVLARVAVEEALRTTPDPIDVRLVARRPIRRTSESGVLAIDAGNAVPADLPQPQVRELVAAGLVGLAEGR